MKLTEQQQMIEAEIAGQQYTAKKKVWLANTEGVKALVERPRRRRRR